MSPAYADEAPELVVELFTSEGCSSCPSADKLLGELPKITGQKLIILSEHVDYWNYLGWRDPYSSAQFTNRQKDYAKAFRQESLYTPQMVVNGSEGFVGSNANSAVTAIKAQSVEQQSNHKLLVRAVKKRGQNSVRVTIKDHGPALSAEEKIVVFLTQDSVIVPVKTGENSGRVLRHSGVVLTLKTIDGISESCVLALPTNIDTSGLKVVTIRQNMRTMRINGAGNSAIGEDI